MTVRDLITKLAAYPPDAEVHLIGLETPWFADRREAVAMMADKKDAQPGEGTLEYTQRWCDEYSGNMLYIDAETTDDNAYRRGALEQLFDEVSTGIAPCGATHAEIREAGGDDKWSELGDKMMLEDEVRQAIEKHLNLLLVEAVAYTAMRLAQDWPDEDGIREDVNGLYWARLDDELRNTPVDISEDVREYTSAWEVFVGMVFERARKAAENVKGR